jgi:hypothetical protein
MAWEPWPRRALLTLATLSVAWSVVWFGLAWFIESRFDAWVAQQRAEGMAVSHGERGVRGFPLGWRLAVEQPELAGAGPTGWQWKGNAVILALRPWAPREFAIELPGEHRFWLGRGRTAETLVLWAQRPNGLALLSDAGKLDRITLDLADVHVRRLPDHAVTRMEQAQAIFTPHRGGPAGHATDVFDATLVLRGVTLAHEPPRGMSRRIERASLDAGFMGRLPPGALAESIRAWRDDGGTVEVKRLDVAWGALAIDGNGTLALDGENRPLGAFTAKIAGLAETLDALGEAGLIAAREAAAMKIAIGLFSRAEPGGDHKRLTLPLTAQDGVLFIAGLPLVRLDPLRFD